MNRVDLSGILVSEIFYKEFVNEVSVAFSDGQLSFGELTSLAGLMANKVVQFESLSSEQKYDVMMKLVNVAVQKVLLDNPSLSEKIESAMELVKSILPSVLKAVDVSSKNAILKHLNKTPVLSDISELVRAMTCSSCLNVEEPVVIVKPKKTLPLETKAVVNETVVPVEPVVDPVQVSFVDPVVDPVVSVQVSVLEGLPVETFSESSVDVDQDSVVESVDSLVVSVVPAEASTSKSRKGKKAQK
jgi:hypothetical protein